ncbi:hypothetical protein L1049_022704 [Liquidambar formosana]|uniref:Phytocyanin domain-containing protein n=1 Tax=Liquidambar formosana TaxID=63359 RepID=A0AAP0WPB4_LIQFO
MAALICASNLKQVMIILLTSRVAVFPYWSGVNNVIQVGEEDFDACTQNEVIDMFHDGPTIILLDKPGEYFYYSGVGKHCELGQKLAVTVTNKEGSSGAPFTLDLSSSETTAAAPSPVAILPSKSSATSIRSFGVVSGFLAFLLSLFIWGRGLHLYGL